METEGNKVLAEFMGVKVVPYAHFTGENVLAIVPNEGCIDWPTLNVYRPDQSLDLLMPVWIKFRDLSFSYHSDPECSRLVSNCIHKLVNANSPSDFFPHLVEAVKWYQSTKK